MNKIDAKVIAKTITNEQLQQMFDNAKANITDWTQISSVNKGMTKGTAWNILAKDFNVLATHHSIAKKNMIWEFGDYLPESLKIPKKKKIVSSNPIHQKPIF